jgi:hypothetical protein
MQSKYLLGIISYLTDSTLSIPIDLKLPSAYKTHCKSATSETVNDSWQAW